SCSFMALVSIMSSGIGGYEPPPLGVGFLDPNAPNPGAGQATVRCDQYAIHAETGSVRRLGYRYNLSVYRMAFQCLGKFSIALYTEPHPVKECCLTATLHRIQQIVNDLALIYPEL